LFNQKRKFMKYTRIYADATGESHFEDVMVHFSPVEYAPPAMPINMSAPFKSERTIMCSIPSEWLGDWHPSPHKQFFMQTSGRLEVETSDGEKRNFSPGSIILLEDTFGKGHLTRAMGYASVHGVFIQLKD